MLLTDTGLTNARNSFGLIPTWPTKLIPMMMTIDHYLVSEAFKVVTIRIGEDLDSDHLPLVVKLGVCVCDKEISTGAAYFDFYNLINVSDPIDSINVSDPIDSLL